MAGKIGHVRERVRASGQRYWYVDCRPAGRVFSIPDPAGRPLPIPDRRTAERVLEAIRKAYIDSGNLERAIAPWLSKPSAALLIESKVEVWLDWYRELVSQGKRSPNSLRELERYARLDGHFSFWYGRTILEISTPTVDDFALWLGKRGMGLKSQRNALTSFRGFVSWLRRRGELDGRPDVHWPVIDVAEHVPRVLTVEAQDRVLAAIPWELRGAFMAAAYESLRVSEVRAFDCDDYLGGGNLRLAAALQGSRADARRSHTKNRSATMRELWHPELVRWIEWRLELFSPEARLGGETALFWNPRPHNAAKRWVPAALRNTWHEACERAGVGHIGLQEGTRHSTLTALGAALPERVLRAYSRHRDARSLDHYAKPKATPDAIVRALRPRQP
ncbi:MAG TPA: hypothetical protein VKM54_22690 [Myxococcota bacterium]|nr:hypothetical protein [Myxococcota bacterium]